MRWGQRVGILFAVLAGIIITDNVLIYRFFQQTANYGRFLTIATQQSFLVQRMEFFLRFFDDDETGVRRSLIRRPAEEAIESFSRSLETLEQGDASSADTLPHAPTQAAEALAQQRELWEELRPLLLRLLEPLDENTSGQARTVYIERAGALIPQLAESTVAVVTGLELWREDLREGFLYLGIGSTIFAALVLVGAMVFTWREFVTPVERLREAALRVREQDLPEPSGNELQTVTKLFSEMTTDVERLRSEREEVEEELRQVEADYQGIFENAVAGICQFDLEGRLLLANAAMAELVGYSSPLELLNTVTNAHEELFADLGHRDELVKAVRGTKRLDSETTLRRKDGGIIWVCESGRFHGGLRDGYFESIVIDVTPRKKAEESLRELSNLLLRSQEQERRRIARELHDSTGQMLAALEINLDGIDEVSEKLSAETMETLSSCRKLVTECSREVRSISHLLHPPMLEELGLVFALREYAEGFSRRSGIEVDLKLPPDLPRVPDDVELAMFRVVQEALTNIHRHAESPTAKICLTAESDEIRLLIEDQGKGIARHRAAGSDAMTQMGVGIRGMAERLKQLGGELGLQSGPNGTTIRASLPLRRSVSAES